MTLGEKISSLRKERGLTQAELGNELGVTYQAVSKWERDDSMPDFDMISKLAKLFGVSISYFENGGDINESDYDTTAVVVEDEDEVVEPTSQMLGVCTVCGKYVNKDNVAVESPRLVCKDCRDKQLKQAERDAMIKRQLEQAQRDEISARFNKRAIIAAIVAGIISIVIFVVQLVNMSSWQEEFGQSTGAYVGTAIFCLIALFTWIFQLFFYGAVRSVTLSGLFFIKLPGIIFSADLDGLIFLIVMKIIFFIISAVVFIVAIVVTSFVGMLLSLFTFVPVIIKIIRRNEDILGD